MEESEILNQRFLELLNSRHAHEPSSENHGAPFQITLEEEHEIKERFKIMAGGRDSINYAEFRDSLGLLGREDSFIRRIFRLIDCEGEGEISEEDYLRYIHTVIHGSEFERQLFGWKIFSGGRDELQLKDLSSLFEEISILWNALTGEIVQPKAKYIEELFSILDVDQDDVITFQEYPSHKVATGSSTRCSPSSSAGLSTSITSISTTRSRPKWRRPRACCRSTTSPSRSPPRLPMR